MYTSKEFQNLRNDYGSVKQNRLLPTHLKFMTFFQVDWHKLCIIETTFLRPIATEFPFVMLNRGSLFNKTDTLTDLVLYKNLDIIG